MRDAGIKTLQDMVAVNTSKLPKIPYASLETLQKAQLQAKSLIENKVLQIADLDGLPDTPLKVYFDIEGNPLLDIDYLFGFWVSGDPKRQYALPQNTRFYDGEEGYFLYFLAESPEDEKTMWEAFIGWIECLPEQYTVYHYANYEKSHLKKLADLYGDSPALQRFQDKLVDLQKVIERSIVFPLYFYSIKDIAKSPFLNFEWRHQKAGGGQSVFWYDQWLATGDRAILKDIVNYNEDDVRATENLYIGLLKMKNEKDILDLVYKSILKCKELIFYGVQLSEAVQRGSIRPEYFEKQLIVPEPHSRNGFCINLDWTKHVEIFKETADDALVHIASFAIIVCKESYPEVLWVNEKDNSDLYAAQMILKFVRDAMGHMRVSSVTGATPYWTINKNNRRIYKIQSLDFTLDAHDLHDKQFKFSHIGGISNLLSILDYLIQDIKKRQSICI